MRRRVPLAWRNITESKLRLLTGIAGIAFAVILMFMQNGFRSALVESMVELIDQLDADLIITSRGRYIFSVQQTFPFRRLNQSRNFADVTHAHPVYLETRAAKWKDTDDGIARRIRVVGFHPEDDIFTIPEIHQQLDKLKIRRNALADRKSKEKFYGKLVDLPESQLKNLRFKIAGLFSLGTDFQNNGTLIISEADFLDLFPERRGASVGDMRVDIGLIKVKPGVDIEPLRVALDDALPDDVDVLTKREFVDKERAFWRMVTPIGIIFTIGVVIGFIVGLMICYQILFSDITDRLPEFATLKAIGYSQRDLFQIVIDQALLLSLFGYVCGIIVSFFLYWWVGQWTGLPMRMNIGGIVVVFLFTVIMCVASGFVAVRRLLTVDPAELFR